MTFNSSIEELNELGERFHNWKQNNSHQRVPKWYWDDAFKLVSKHSLEDVAKSIGFSLSYLLLKQRKRQPVIPPEIAFVEIQPRQPISDHHQIRMNVQDRHGVTIELSFQGGIEQTFPLIYSLFKGGTACSK